MPSTEVNEQEARAVLAIHLASLRDVQYRLLVERLLDRQEVIDVVGASGTQYQLEFQAFWDSVPDSILRVSGSIDDGGWRCLAPVTDSFLVSPDGSLMEEGTEAGCIGEESTPAWRLPRAGFVGVLRFLAGVFARSFVAGFQGRSIDGWPPRKRKKTDGPIDDETDRS